MMQTIKFKRIITCPLDMSFCHGLLRSARNDVSGDVRGVMECRTTYPRQGRHCERSEATQCKQLKPGGLVASFVRSTHGARCHLIPALVSLGIHALIASFFIPSFLKPCAQMGAPVEVVWEARQAKPALLSSPSKVNEEKKRARLNQSPERCKEIDCTQKKTHPKQTVQRVYNPLVEQKPSASGDASETGSQEKLTANISSPPSAQRHVYQPLPKYPWISRKRGHEGVVALTVKTNEEGKVIEAKLHKSSGHAPLDECALETVKSWVFADGPIQKELSIAFRLKNLEGKLEESV